MLDSIILRSIQPRIYFLFSFYFYNYVRSITENSETGLRPCNVVRSDWFASAVDPSEARSKGSDRLGACNRRLDTACLIDRSGSAAAGSRPLASFLLGHRSRLRTWRCASRFPETVGYTGRINDPSANRTRIAGRRRKQPSSRIESA